MTGPTNNPETPPGRIDTNAEPRRTVPASEQNPNECTHGHACGQHEEAHEHGPGCGHEPIQHAGHIDYLVAGHLHRNHMGHCDHHGPIEPGRHI